VVEKPVGLVEERGGVISFPLDGIGNLVLVPKDYEGYIVFKTEGFLGTPSVKIQKLTTLTPEQEAEIQKIRASGGLVPKELSELGSRFLEFIRERLKRKESEVIG